MRYVAVCRTVLNRCVSFADEKPDPQSHIRIVSFDERLRTMNSMRKPKCLTIHGTDEREYLFLVKVRCPLLRYTVAAMLGVK